MGDAHGYRTHTALALCLCQIIGMSVVMRTAITLTRTQFSSGGPLTSLCTTFSLAQGPGFIYSRVGRTIRSNFATWLVKAAKIVVWGRCESAPSPTWRRIVMKIRWPSRKHQKVLEGRGKCQGACPTPRLGLQERQAEVVRNST